jgi:hypothetical protein
MIDDLIAEVCTEIVLLSTFASHVGGADIATLERDEAMLLSVLSLLAEHAQKVRGSDAGDSCGYCDGSTSMVQHTPPNAGPQQKAIKRTESGLASPHEWVTEVLQDLTNYTRRNGLHDLADSLQNVRDRSRDQLSANVPADPNIDCVGAENIVAFDPAP